MSSLYLFQNLEIHCIHLMPLLQALLIVGDRDRTISVEVDVDARRVAGKGFIDAVVHHLLHKVVGPRGVGIHPGTFTHRLKARQDFYISGVVAGAQWVILGQ